MSRPAPLFFLPPSSSSANNRGEQEQGHSQQNAHASNASASDSEPPSPTVPTAPHTPRSLSFLTPAVPPRDPSFASSLNNASANYPYANPFASNNTAPSTPGQQTPGANPFSPPASVRSFSASSPLHSPAASATPLPLEAAGGGYFSADSTRASSLVDVPRYSGSRPGTGAGAGASPLGQSSPGTPGSNTNTVKPKRSTFASPPPRPLTIYAQGQHQNASTTAAAASAGARRRKSTALLVPNGNVVGDAGETYRASLAASGEKGVKVGTYAELTQTLSKPWTEKKDPRGRVAYWLTYGVILGGLAAGAARIYTGYKGVMLLKDPLCPVLSQDFTNTTTAQLFGSGPAGEGGTWFREVDASGFGNGEFEMTTASDSNSFVYNDQLYLVPTLTSDVIPMGSILDGAVYNLTDCTYNITHSSGYTTTGHGSAGINTTEGAGGADGGGIAPDTPLDLAAYLAACSAVSNATEGRILPPVMSARISTRRSASMKFGRVEVRAKLPTGDWMWPAIWMLPVDSAYGPWPLSGEIDIMEARGNGPSYPKQGVNYVRTSLNWGPATFLNAVAKTFGWLFERRGRFDEEFHTFALEWNEDFIRTYVDSRLNKIYEVRLNKESFWQRGDFPTVVQNGTQSVVLNDPWVNGTKAAPFDQPFYLIMNVAVGGTNGWFPDGPEKPWLDGSGTAPLDFLRAQDKWYPTWPQDVRKRAMVIDSVKMWEKCQS